MKKQYNFIEDLQQKLTQFHQLDDEIAELSAQKEIIKDQIKKWLEIHESELYEAEDLDGQLWKIYKYTFHSNKVKDYDLLKSVLSDQHKHLIVESDTEAFSVRRINKHSKEWLILN